MAAGRGWRTSACRPLLSNFLHLCNHTFHAEVLSFGLCCLDHGLRHVFQVLRKPDHEAVKLGKAAAFAVIVALWVRALQLGLELVRLH